MKRYEMKKILIKIDELPALIELSDKNGVRKKLYKLNPAGKKFGAALNIVDPEMIKLLTNKK
jgi:hypothetical protein